jgi:hypothetical protein
LVYDWRHEFFERLLLRPPGSKMVWNMACAIWKGLKNFGMITGSNIKKVKPGLSL